MGYNAGMTKTKHVVYLSDATHRKVKMAASLAGTTLSAFAEALLLEGLASEEKRDFPQRGNMSPHVRALWGVYLQECRLVREAEVDAYLEFDRERDFDRAGKPSPGREKREAFAAAEAAKVAAWEAYVAARDENAIPAPQASPAQELLGALDLQALP